MTDIRIRRSLLICLLAPLALSALVYAASPVRIVVNGVDLGPAAGGRVISDQVMVPIRAVGEALGAEARWVPGESCVYITTKGAVEAAKEAASVSAEKQETAVYLTEAGNKYHRLACRTYSEDSMPISSEEAKARGTHHVVCGPPQ